MDKNKPYLSLCKMLEDFEERSLCTKNIAHSKDLCSGALFVSYIAERAEPENKPQRMQDHPDEFARSFVSGIKTYIKQHNQKIDNKFLQYIKNIALKEPQSLAYIIEDKRTPYVKGIIHITYEALSNGIGLKDVGHAVKSATKEFRDSMPKHREYWATYRSIEKLLSATEKNNKYR